MNKKVLRSTFVAAIAMVSGVNVFSAQKTEALSDLVLANVEALANNMRWCSDCGECTGSYIICESGYDAWWDDMFRNCSSINVDLELVPGC